MNKLLKQIPVFILLIPVFYVMHVCNEYFNSYPLKYPLYYLGIYLALSLAVYGFAWLIFKRKDKAGLWSCEVLLILLFFGVAVDFLRSHTWTAIISSYKILIPLIPIVIIGTAIVLRRSRLQFHRSIRYFNILFLLLVLIEAGQMIIQKVSKQTDYTLNPALKLPALSQRPDIFFIVFDEYASSIAIRKHLKFDNSELDSILKANHFFIASNSKANYNYTPFSIASSLNLGYVNGNYENASAETKSLLKGTNMVRESFLPQWLATHQYEIVNLGIFSFDDHPSPELPYFLQTSQQIFYQETLWNRIDDEIGYHFRSWLPSWKPDLKKDLHLVERHQTVFNQLQKELKAQSAPKFVYAHFLMPHAPFLLDRNGNAIQTDVNVSTDSLYLEQVRFCNKWISALAKNASLQFARPRMIIIEGDHGLRESNGLATPRDLQMRNLNTIYFSDHNYIEVYDSIGPINVMRIAMNKYFRATLPLVKDSTVALVELHKK